MKKYFYAATLIALGMTLLFIDFYTKAYAYSCLPTTSLFSGFPVREIRVFENIGGIDFFITLALNKGAAWGLFSQWQMVILVIRIAVIGGMLWYLFFARHPKARDIPLLLIITGALGNVIDFFLYGSVVDFLRFNLWGYPFPVFNFADILITLGVVSYFFTTLFQNKSINHAA